jgi:hypothetical protein
MNKENTMKCFTALSALAVALTVSSASAVDFRVRIENVSTPQTLMTSKGDKNVPISPGAWALHTGNNPIYEMGESASKGLEKQAEDGDPRGLHSDLQLKEEVKATGSFDFSALPYPFVGPIGSNRAYEFVVSNVSPGDRLSFATMFIESNDWFFSNNEAGIELMAADGTPFSGEVTNTISLMDAGTEGNQEAGTGMFQAPRQGQPDKGSSTERDVYLIMAPGTAQDGPGSENEEQEDQSSELKAPSVESVIRVTITPV